MASRSASLLLVGALTLGFLTAAGPSAPTLTGLTISPRTVDVTDAPAEVDVEISVADPDGAVYDVHVRLTDAHGRSVAGAPYGRWSGTPQDGSWRVTAQVPRYAAAGQWLTSIHVYREGEDVFWSSSDLADFGFDPTVTVLDENPDLAPPQLVDVHFSTDTADVGSGPVPVVVAASVTDTEAGVDGIEVSLERDGGSDQHVQWRWAELVAGDRHSGDWQAHLTLPRNAGDGRWYVVATMRDLAGNIVHLPRTQVALEHPHAFVTVVGTSEGGADIGAPEVKALAIDPTSVDVTEGSRRVQVDARLVDPSGVEYAELRLRRGDRSFHGQTMRWSGSAQDGTWRGYIDIPDYVVPGEYGLELSIQDQHGNYRSYSTENLRAEAVGPVSVTVLNATPDVEGPTVTAFEPASREVDTTDGPVSFDSVLGFADDRTGVAYASLRYQATGQYGYGSRYAEGYFLDGHRLDGRWSLHTTFYDGDVFGPWDAGVWLYDFAGNHTYVSAADLRALGLDPTIRVGRRPAAPQDTTVTPGGDLTSVVLSWTPVVDESNQPIVGYRIYRDGELVGETAGTTSQYTDRGLLPATAYTWHVTAVGAHLEGRPSAEVCGTTDPITAGIHPGC